MEQSKTVSNSESRLGMWNVGLYAVSNLPLIQMGDDIGELIYEKASKDDFSLSILSMTHTL